MNHPLKLLGLLAAFGPLAAPAQTPVLTLTGGGTPLTVTGGALTVLGDARIDAGTILDNAGPLSISGTLAAPAGTVRLTGAGAQALNVAGTVGELVLDKSSGTATLSRPLAVAQVLRLTGGTLSTGGNLTLLSTATRQAYAVHDGGTTAGNVTVQRYVGGPTRLGYRHLSSPVQAAPVSDLATTGFTPKVNAAYNALPTPTLPAAQMPTVFGYDETRGGTTPAYAGFGYGYFSPAGLGTVLIPGRGYSVYMPGAKTPDFVGALTTGNVPVTLSVTGTNTSPNDQKAGWHLLGNPYAQPMDWDLVMPGDGAGQYPATMTGAISVYRTTGGNNGQYLTRANGMGSLTDGLLPVGQAFFTRATATSTFTFTNALRVEANPGPVARPAADPRPQVVLTLNKAGAVEQDQAVVYFQAGATPGLDAEFDGERPNRNTGTVPTLSTLTSVGQDLAINGLPATALAAGTTVELLPDLPTAGDYELTATTLANLPAGTTLLDRKLGTRTALVAGTSYAFSATHAGTVAGRFALAFAPVSTVTGTSDLSPLTSHLTVFPNPTSGSQVRVLGVAVGHSVRLLDATGRVVRTVIATTDGATLAVAGLPTGVYVVRAGALIQRLVVE